MRASILKRSRVDEDEDGQLPARLCARIARGDADLDALIFDGLAGGTDVLLCLSSPMFLSVRPSGLW